MRRGLAVLAAGFTLIVAACGGAGGGTSAAGCTIGVSWNNYQEERWAKWDEPAIKKAITDAGGKYISNDAKSSAETQASNVDNLISQGAKVVIVLAQDGTAIKPAVAKAIAGNVPVIAYDRLIEDPKALYITFDNVLVGKLEAEAIFKAKPKGNYAIIKGNKANKNAVDAVLSENDGMAGGVIAALTAQGLAGKVPVSGQDGDKAALNRVALGTQTVDVWKDARLLGKTAGEAATQLCGNADVSKVKNTSIFKTPGGNSVSSILLTPNPITQANLKEVLDAGWVTKADLCQGVAAGKVSACG